MADKKISQLTALSAANLAPSTDVLAIVDTSATETKKIVAQDLVNGVLNVASAVGIGTSSPLYKLDVNGQVIGLGTNTASSGAGGQLRFRDDTGSFRWLVGLSGAAATTFQIYDNVASLTRLAIDTSGNLGIGTSSPDGPLQVSFANAETSQFNAGAAVAYLTNTNTTNNNWAQIFWTDSDNGAASAAFGAQYTDHTNDYAALSFSTRGTSGLSERARITSGGYFKASNDGTYPYSATGAHEIKQTANTTTLFLTNTNAGFTTNLLQVECSTAAGTGWNFARFFANGSAQAEIRGDGNLYNTNGTYGTISDARLKQDIADAPSQWGDIKAIQFRKYRMKADVEANPDAPELLGVVAQELEQTSPGLVDEGSDGIKSVKTSILLMKAAVALQEAMTRIEQLEAKVAALESK
jgi:hypothetical protein